MPRYSGGMSTTALPTRHEIEARILKLLVELDDLRGPGLSDGERRPRAWLKAWQGRRLAQTHAALLQNPRYAPAARFFLEDLYGPKDHRARDQDLARVLPKLLKVLPQAAQWTMAQALRMDALSERLDAQMAQALQVQGALRHEADLSAEQYAQAYRSLGQRAQRQEQLDLVMQIGQSLDHLTRLPMLAASLKLMKKPAELAGLSELHGFLQRGFTAFVHMKGAEEFLQRIVQEERALMINWLQQ